MSNQFDPYREALVMEQLTVWPEQYDAWEPAEKAQIEAQLHAEPEKAADLEYTQQHSGFCRQISVTPEDIERLT